MNSHRSVGGQHKLKTRSCFPNISPWLHLTPLVCNQIFIISLQRRAGRLRKTSALLTPSCAADAIVRGCRDQRQHAGLYFDLSTADDTAESVWRVFVCAIECRVWIWWGNVLCNSQVLILSLTAHAAFIHLLVLLDKARVMRVTSSRRVTASIAQAFRSAAPYLSVRWFFWTISLWQSRRVGCYNISCCCTSPGGWAMKLEVRLLENGFTDSFQHDIGWPDCKSIRSAYVYLKKNGEPTRYRNGTVRKRCQEECLRYAVSKTLSQATMINCNYSHSAAGVGKLPAWRRNETISW